jgi:hypothetical protein
LPIERKQKVVLSTKNKQLSANPLSNADNSMTCHKTIISAKLQEILGLKVWVTSALGCLFADCSAGLSNFGDHHESARASQDLLLLLHTPAKCHHGQQQTTASPEES